MVTAWPTSVMSRSPLKAASSPAPGRVRTKSTSGRMISPSPSRAFASMIAACRVHPLGSSKKASQTPSPGTASGRSRILPTKNVLARTGVGARTSASGDASTATPTKTATRARQRRPRRRREHGNADQDGDPTPAVAKSRTEGSQHRPSSFAPSPSAAAVASRHPWNMNLIDSVSSLANDSRSTRRPGRRPFLIRERMGRKRGQRRHCRHCLLLTL